jgi:hypothetical protein
MHFPAGSAVVDIGRSINQVPHVGKARLSEMATNPMKPRSSQMLVDSRREIHENIAELFSTTSRRFAPHALRPLIA